MKKKILSMLILFCFIGLGSVKVFASIGDTFVTSSDNIKYTITTDATATTNGTVSAGMEYLYETDVTIPAQVTNNGYTYDVTKLTNGGFMDCIYLRSITIPASVTSIGLMAFYECQRLSTITIKATSLVVSRNAFEGISTEAIFYVENETVRDVLENYGIEEGSIVVGNPSESLSYSVTVDAEKGGSAGGGGAYQRGDIVTLRASAKTGYKFGGWEVNYGRVDIDDETAEKTTFKMPSRNVSITATFTYIGSGSTVTVDKWEDIVEVINPYGNDITSSDIEIMLPSDNRVATQNFNAAIGNNLNLIVNGTWYKWSIYGKDIKTDIYDKAYCNMGVQFIADIDTETSNVFEGKDILRFKLDNNGELPFEGELIFNIGDYVPNVTAEIVYLYAYDATSKTMRYMGSGTIDQKKWGLTKIYISENADYIVTTAIIKGTKVKEDISEYEDNYSVVPYYLDGKEKVYIPESKVDGENSVYVAPVTAVYGYEDYSDVTSLFLDCEKIWSRNAVNYTVARDLVQLEVEELFDIERDITRENLLKILAGIENVKHNTDIFAWAEKNGLLNGIGNKDFDKLLTRQDLALVLYYYCEYKGIKMPSEYTRPKFIDGMQIKAVGAVSTLYEMDILNARANNRFEPDSVVTKSELVFALLKLNEIQVKDKSITRAELIKALARIDGVNDEEVIYDWAEKNGILTGIGKVNFELPMTRQEMALTIYYFCLYKQAKLPNQYIKQQFADEDSIGAKIAIKSLYEADILYAHIGNRFEPSAVATKAELSYAIYKLGETLYMPNKDITRAQLIKSLAKIDNVSVATDIYDWAESNGILKGMGRVNFDLPITRQEMALAVYYYCEYKGILLPNEYQKPKFDDDYAIGAKRAVSALYEMDILVGRNANRFEPNSIADKEELSLALYKIIEYLD